MIQNHPLARRYGLMWCVAPQFGGLRDVVGGGVGTLLPNGVLAGASPHGQALRSTALHNGGAHFPFPERLRALSDHFSIVVCAAPLSFNTYSHLISIPITTEPALALRLYDTSQLMLTFNQGTSNSPSAAGMITPTDGWTLYTATKAGDRIRFYKNGDTAGISDYAGAAVWSSHSKIALFDHDGYNGMAGDLGMAAIFAAPLPEDAIAALARDWTQLFAPRIFPFYLPPPALPPAPTASFSATPLTGSAPLTVQFADTSNGIVTGRGWDFTGDGTTDSDAANPSYTYTTPGTYSARLTVSNGGGSAQATQIINVALTTTAQPAGLPNAPDEIRFIIECDWGRDGTFAHALANITDRVKALAWNIGMNDAWQEFAPPSRCEVRLYNEDGAFAPDRLDAPYHGLLANGVLLRVRAWWNGSYRPLWVGKLARIDVSPGERINRNGGWGEARLTAEDPMLALLDTEVIPTLLRNLSISQAMGVLFERAAFLYPYDSSFWILGHHSVGAARLFICDYAAFEPALTTLAWVGDHLDQGRGVRAQTYLRDLVAAEAGGRFFWDARAGVFRFHNRHHDAQAVLTATLTEDDMTGAQAAYGEDVANVVTVEYQPRALGSAGSVIWNTAFRLKARQTKTFIARHRDANDPTANVAALDVIPPVPGFDLTAKRYYPPPAPLTPDVSGALLVTTEAGASASKITLYNPLSYQVEGTLQLRGTPLTSFARTQVTVLDAHSIAAHDRREKHLSLPAVDDDEYAAGIAAVTLQRFKDAHHRLHSISFVAQHGDILRAAALERTIGDRVHIREAWSAHAADYIIVGERHQVDIAAHEQRVTWILKPLAREVYWVLQDAQRGELDGDNVISL
ncbi:MAG: PKD domain-containing protein [Chloroflexota bacterium]|nr:PKD domain-containing protein [Chloroflexota bacterium]